MLEQFIHFSNPWERSFKNFRVRLQILTEKKKMVLDFIVESLTKQEVIQDKESAAFSSEKN